MIKFYDVEGNTACILFGDDEKKSFLNTVLKNGVYRFNNIQKLPPRAEYPGVCHYGYLPTYVLFNKNHLQCFL